MIAEGSQFFCNKKLTLSDFKTMIGASCDGILLTDEEGNILLFNESYTRLSGTTSEQLKGRNVQYLVDNGFIKQSVALLVLEKKESVTLSHFNLPGGTCVVTGNPIFDEQGNICRVVTNVRDISEAYELRQKLNQAHEMENLFYKQLDGDKGQECQQKGLIAISPAMKKVLSLADTISHVDVTVLILGESGVGKEVIADYIHKNSHKNKGPFIAVNCGAIPEQLLESELFGYVGGAFTGALKNGKTGLFEEAENGTLFLDEIGELPLNLQVKLLRVLEEREITRIGSSKAIPINARILAATNRNLEELVQKQEFREDLYYRLNVIQINIPPLRERPEDIAPLAMYFMQRFNVRYNMQRRMSHDVITAFQNYKWPGNIREMKNIVERLVVVSNGEYMEADQLPFKKTEPVQAAIKVNRVVPLNKAIEEVERQILSAAMEEYRSSRKIATAVGVNQSTVLRKLKKYGLDDFVP